MKKEQFKQLVKECVKSVIFEREMDNLDPKTDTMAYEPRDRTEPSTTSSNTNTFITDFEMNVELQNVSNQGIPVTKLPRYSVWVYDTIKGKPQVKETSDDLKYLQTKYNVSTDKVIKIGKSFKKPSSEPNIPLEPNKDEAPYDTNDPDAEWNHKEQGR